MASFRILHRGILTLTLSGSALLAGLGVAGAAQARMPEGDLMSDHAVECAHVQDNYDDAVARYHDATTAAGKAHWQATIAGYMTQWESYGCDEDYGAISVMPFVPDRPGPKQVRNPGEMSGGTTLTSSTGGAGVSTASQ